MRTALSPDERLERVRENMLAWRGPYLAPYDPQWIGGTLSICGYGPSLADTWGLTIGPVMTTSGAHDFMLGKGVVPTSHVELDPREHKAWLLTPHRKVRYFINSQCHPKLFEKLKGYDVTMWHSVTEDDKKRQVELIESICPGLQMMTGGTNVGMRAICVARHQGHTGFELHGFDCSFRGATQWAGEHMTKAYYSVRVSVDGEEFDTSDTMLQSTDDLINTMMMMPGCRFRVHGDGLLERRLRMLNADQARALAPGWWKPVNFVLNEAVA